MNRHNVIYGETEETLTAEWCDRAPDDDDRYTNPTSIFIRVEVPKAGGQKTLNSAMAVAYDKWIAGRN